MVELRYSVRPDTNTEAPRLQYRFMEPYLVMWPTIHIDFLKWSAWIDVPIFVEPISARPDQSAEGERHG